MKLKLMRRLSMVVAVIMLTVFVAGCGPLSNDLELKRAFVQFPRLEMYEADIALNVAVDPRRMDRNVQANRIFFEYADFSSLRINHRFISHSNQRGGTAPGSEVLTNSRVRMTFGRDLGTAIEHDMIVYTQYRYGDLTQGTSRLFVTQAFRWNRVPSHIEPLMPERRGRNWFTLHLDDQPFIRDLLAGWQAGTTPNWNQLLSNLSWTRLNARNFRTSLTDDMIKRNFDLLIASTMLSTDDELNQTWETEWAHRWEEAKNAFTFRNTNVYVTLEQGSGHINHIEFESAVDFDIFTFNNRVMGRPYGRDVTIPLIVNLSIGLTTIPALVETFFFPALGAGDLDFQQHVPWRRMLPEFRPIPPMYEDGSIRVFIEDRNGEVEHFLADRERRFQEVRFQSTLPPIIYNDRVLLPVRYMMEAFGGSITDHGGGRVSTVLDMRSVVMERDSDIAMVRGQQFRLPAPVGIAHDAFYAPVLLFDQAFDALSITEVEHLEDGTNLFNIFFVTQ